MELSAYHHMAEIEDRHWWFDGRRAIAEAMIKTLELPLDARILEIGAGTGGNLSMLDRFGSVTGVEMNALARSIARAKTGRSLLEGHLPEKLPIDDKQFDLVCLFDVLEHVSEDRGSLRTIRGLLSDGGRLILTVPAHQWLWSLHDVDLHHHRRYSKPQLADAIESAGLAIERLTYINAALFPLAVASRLADRFRASGASAGSVIPPPVLNAVLKAIYASERHVLPRMSLPFGLSLLAVARLGDDAATRQTAG